MNESLKLTLEEGKLADVLTVIFFHVDEFYQQVSHLVDRTGPKPTFSDSEVITLTLVNQMVIDRSGGPVRDSLPGRRSGISSLSVIINRSSPSSLSVLAITGVARACLNSPT